MNTLHLKTVADTLNALGNLTFEQWEEKQRSDMAFAKRQAEEHALEMHEQESKVALKQFTRWWKKENPFFQTLKKIGYLKLASGEFSNIAYIPGESKFEPSFDIGQIYIRSSRTEPFIFHSNTYEEECQPVFWRVISVVSDLNEVSPRSFNSLIEKKIADECRVRHKKVELLKQ